MSGWTVMLIVKVVDGEPIGGVFDRLTPAIVCQQVFLVSLGVVGRIADRVWLRAGAADAASIDPIAGDRRAGWLCIRQWRMSADRGWKWRRPEAVAKGKREVAAAGYSPVEMASWSLKRWETIPVQPGCAASVESS